MFVLKLTFIVGILCGSFLLEVRTHICTLNPKKTANLFMQSFNEFKILAPIMTPTSGGMISASRTEYLQSFEIYTCSEESKTLIGSHIANFVRAEKRACLDEYSTHSVIFISSDGKRIVHQVGWRERSSQDPFTLKVNGVFKEFQRRADGKDGTPAALKESSHIYIPRISLPTGSTLLMKDSSVFDTIYSIDLYTCKMPSFQESLVSKLEQAGKFYEFSPDLITYQILSSVDGLSCVCIGSWKMETAREKMQVVDPFAYIGYQKLMAEISHIAVPGTMSDIIDHTGFPNRIYRVFDFEADGEGAGYSRATVKDDGTISASKITF